MSKVAGGIAVALALMLGVLMSDNIKVQGKNIGKYIVEHNCTRVYPPTTDPMYECEGKKLTSGDIVNITSN